MIEPILSLAISMHANPGVYALLVGSGLSCSARIPTGWEVVLDLARKLAALQNEDCEPDPAAWYHHKFGRDADYSELLDAIGKSPAERQQLLRSYFEPTEEEREQGFKQPTHAHRAIAKLVAGGYCRVILTTNFDKLIERAIEDEGIPPVVLSTPDAVEGALPLVHQRCCVVKLHGDYLDTRIKNTPAELADYDERLNRLLDQVFDSFGVIVCGWSAQWDSALRAAIERCPSRRFTTYWASRGKLTDEADRLVTQRAGEVISIDDADCFFGRLAELVSTLKDSKRQHPGSVEAAVALTKRYLSDVRHLIELEDLVTNETEAAHRRIEAYRDEVLQSKASSAVVFQNHRDILERLQHVMIHGAAYGSSQQDPLWVWAIQRIAGYEKESGTVLREGIRQYPAVFLMYSAGMAAISKGRFYALKKLLVEPKLRRHGETRLLLTAIDYSGMHQFAKAIDEHNRHHVPVSEHFFSVLREPLRRLIPDDADYDEAFDRFEFLRALAFAHLEYASVGEEDRSWVPLGRYCWKAHGRFEASIIKQFRSELEETGEDWPPLKGGMMNGSIERTRELMAGIERFVAKLPM